VCKLGESEFKLFRKVVINNVMYTDNKEHFGNLKSFELRFKPPEDFKQVTLGEEEVLILSGIILHTADFHGCAQKFSLSRQWSQRINFEFTEQYNEEKLLGIPQTPYLKDLNIKAVMAKNEIGFMKFIVKPLWEALNSYLKDEIAVSVSNLVANVREWNNILEIEQERSNKEEALQREQEIQLESKVQVDKKVEKPD